MKTLLIGNDEATLEQVHARMRARGLSVIRRRDVSGSGGAPSLGGAFTGEFGVAVVVAMGTRGLGSVSALFMGSVATGVLSLTDLPVTLVK